MRYVNCTEEFLAAANNVAEHGKPEWNKTADFSDIINDITIVLLRNHRVRFYIALGSIAPLLLCAFVSLNRRIESFGMRIFCLNCVFVNLCYTLFLFVRLLALDSWFIMKEQCYYKTGRVPAIKYTETSETRGHFEFFLYRDLDKVTVYATSFPLVMVRLSVYRATVAHLPSSGTNRPLWCIAVAAADLAAVIVGWLDSLMYGPDIDFRIRLGLPVLTLVAIWIAETVLSTLSLITIAKMKLAKKSFTSTQKNNVSQMISFILFSIFPSVLLAPHVYTGLNSVVEEWTTDAVWKCIGDKLVGNNTDFDAVSKECGLEDQTTSVESSLYIALLLSVCQTLNVFKPYVEAFMMLFLLSNFRAVLFSYMRRLTGRANSRVERSVSIRPPKTNTVSASLPASRRQSVWQ